MLMQAARGLHHAYVNQPAHQTACTLRGWYRSCCLPLQALQPMPMLTLLKAYPP